MTQEKFKMVKSRLKFSMFHQYLSQIFTKQVCVFCVLLKKERSIFEDFMGDFWHSGCCTIAHVLHGVGVLQGPVQDSNRTNGLRFAFSRCALRTFFPCNILN